MLDLEVERIHSILTNVLGEPKNEGYSNGWRSYNCPYCADAEGIKSDNKFNLETNVENGSVFHCWKCETKGKLSKLISDYGSAADLAEYKDAIKAIRESSQYRLNDIEVENSTLEVENYIELPRDFKPLTENDKYAFPAFQYLNSRNITMDIIKRYNIGYIGKNAEFPVRSRIIIPSYDYNGDINYWVGRDYTGLNKMKYKNPTVKKTSIVFNEGKVNWYEDITLVEGPFDHIVVPNSIPLLGKTINHDNAVYRALVNKAHANINIFLDDDATENAYLIYKFLNNGVLKDRVRVIECPKGFDASLIYQMYGKKGIVKVLKKVKKVDEYDLLKIKKK